MSGLQTDMNQRERRKYAEQFQTVIDAGIKAREALLAEDDVTFATQLIMFSLVGQKLSNELGEILEETIAVSDAAKKLEDEL